MTDVSICDKCGGTKKRAVYHIDIRLKELHVDARKGVDTRINYEYDLCDDCIQPYLITKRDDIPLEYPRRYEWTPRS